jgi:hypothetical protein
MRKKTLIILLITSLALPLGFLTGCDSQAKSGALIGGAAGAGIGQLAGRDTKATLIGAGIGTAAGYLVGNHMDKKKSGENAPAQEETTVVNITNSNGSITPVTLTKSGNNYIGPKGEIFDHLPTEEELKPGYGY